MEVNVDGNDKLIRTHFTMIVCGQTGAGKTQFIHKLLENIPDIMSHETPFERIIYAYGIYQNFYETISKITKVQLVEGLPELDNTGQKTLLIMDDLFMETNKRIAEIFTRQRHMNLSTIFVVHNFFHECKYMRTISRNANYLVLFRNPRDMCQISCFSRQMYPEDRNFLFDAFKQATEKPYTYLFIDLKPDTPEHYRLKSGILPGENLYYYVKRS